MSVLSGIWDGTVYLWSKLFFLSVLRPNVPIWSLLFCRLTSSSVAPTGIEYLISGLQNCQAIEELEWVSCYQAAQRLPGLSRSFLELQPLFCCGHMYFSWWLVIGKKQQFFFICNEQWVRQRSVVCGREFQWRITCFGSYFCMGLVLWSQWHLAPQGAGLLLQRFGVLLVFYRIQTGPLEMP